MANAIFKKLKIKKADILFVINEPPDFKKGLKILPKEVEIVKSGNDYNQIHWFVLNKAQLEKEMSRILKLLKPGIIVWVYYPKGSSKIQTDLTRDKGWDCLMSESDKLTWISLISFDDTWSVFGFRAKTEEDKKKEAMPKPEREIFKWADPKTKTVKLPEDFDSVLKKNKKELMFFNSLSFTNKKEYIEWIVTAKREQTKIDRINGSVERLGKGWKNPANI